MMPMPDLTGIAAYHRLSVTIYTANGERSIRHRVDYLQYIFTRSRRPSAPQALQPTSLLSADVLRYRKPTSGCRYEQFRRLLWASLSIAAAGIAGRSLAAAEYRIEAYDELAVAVRGSPELSRSAVVRPDGFVSLPLAEDVRAAGLTPPELAAAIAERLSAFLIERQVSVEVVRSAGSDVPGASRSGNSQRDVQLLGGSQPVRAVPFKEGMRLIDVISAVGGVPPGGDASRAVLVREGPDGPGRVPLRLDDLIARGDTSANMAVEPGDTIVVPDGFFSGDWKRRFSASLWTAFTDNYRLRSAGDEDPALITGLTPALQIAGSSPRLTGALSASVTGEYVALTGSEVRAIPNVAATSKTLLNRDTVYLDASALVSELQLNATNPTFDVTNSTDQALVQTYQLSPYSVSRLKDIGYLEARSVLAGTVVNGNGTGSAGARGGERSASTDVSLSDSLTSGALLRLLTSPEHRARLQWMGQAGGAQTTRFGAGDITQAGFSVQPEYAMSHWLAASVSGGWGLLDDGGETLAGPEGLVGLRYEPSPAFSLHATGGWQLEHPAADVFIVYAPSPATSVVARYRDSVGVGQTVLLQTVSDLSFDSQTHQFVERGSSLPYSANLTGLTISNDLTRTQRADLDLSRKIMGEVFGMNAFFVDQDDVGGGQQSGSGSSTASNQTSYGVAGQWTHPVNRETRLITTFSLAMVNDNSGDRQASSGSDWLRTLGVQVTAAHDLTDNVSGFIAYRFQRRFAEDKEDEYTENAVLIGFTRQF